MEILILGLITGVLIVEAYCYGKSVSKLKYQRKICGMMAELVRKNNEELKNCDAKKIEIYKLAEIIEKNKESLRIYDMVIEEFKKIK